MTDLRKAAQMALDWRDKNSELLFELGGWDFIFEINDWSQSIRGALAQPEPEPVAWKMKGVPAFATSRPNDTDSIKWDALYTAPPQREWQGLTDEEIMNACSAVWASHPVEVGQVVAAKLKEKNT